MELITSQLKEFDSKDELDRKDMLNHLLQQLINCLLYIIILVSCNCLIDTIKPCEVVIQIY